MQELRSTSAACAVVSLANDVLYGSGRVQQGAEPVFLPNEEVSDSETGQGCERGRQ